MRRGAESSGGRWVWRVKLIIDLFTCRHKAIEGNGEVSERVYDIVGYRFCHFTYLLKAFKLIIQKKLSKKSAGHNLNLRHKTELTYLYYLAL